MILLYMVLTHTYPHKQTCSVIVYTQVLCAVKFKTGHRHKGRLRRQASFSVDVSAALGDAVLRFADEQKKAGELRAEVDAIKVRALRNPGRMREVVLLTAMHVFTMYSHDGARTFGGQWWQRAWKGSSASPGCSNPHT